MNVALRLLLCLMVLAGQLLVAPAVHAVRPDEMLADPLLEQRARDISKELRCLVCQNEAIDESNAELARDIRLLLRERLMAGDTNAQAKQYLVERYGDYVLLKPPFKATTLLLWLGAPLMLLVAFMLALPMFRRRSHVNQPKLVLTDEEAQRATRLLNKCSEQEERMP